jgi:predicted CopG family antitoxin
MKNRKTITLSSEVYLELDDFKHEVKKEQGQASMDSVISLLLEKRKNLVQKTTPPKTQEISKESIEIERLKKELLIKNEEIKNLKERSENQITVPDQENVKKIKVRSSYKNYQGSRAKFESMISHSSSDYVFDRITFFMINPAVFIILNTARLTQEALYREDANVKEYICELLSKRPEFKFLAREKKFDKEI